jgi:microcystin-dependent protein
MAVPFPIDFTAGALPLGFKGTLDETMQAFAAALSASVDVTFLTGQVGGTMPSSDIGPWLNLGDPAHGVPSGWYFFDARTNQYQPSEQGAPVGTMAIWGGNATPSNWLLCNGAAVSRTTYARLFQAIGTTWGIGDGATSFNLPPGGRIYINAPGFVADPIVPIDAGSANQGVNARGGAQTAMLQSANMPAMKVTIGALQPAFTESPGAYGIPNIQGEGGNFAQTYDYRVRDNKGHLIGQANQTPFNNMPPFVAANFMIKWR